MDALFDVAEGSIGILVWVIWALIGIVEALIASRFSPKRVLWCDIVVGLAAALAGGYYSIAFAGDGVYQRLLISVLGAVMLTTAALWLLGYFIRKK